MNVEITHSRVRLLVWSCSCCSPFGAHHGLAEDESHRAYGGRDVNGKNGAALAASHDHCDHQDQEGDSARQHGRCLALAAAQREPDDEARQRREDEQVPEGLVPALPHVVAAQKAAGERRFQENAEREDPGEDRRGPRRRDASFGWDRLGHSMVSFPWASNSREIVTRDRLPYRAARSCPWQWPRPDPRRHRAPPRRGEDAARLSPRSWP